MRDVVTLFFVRAVDRVTMFSSAKDKVPKASTAMSVFFMFVFYGSCCLCVLPGAKGYSCAMSRPVGMPWTRG